MARKRNEGWQEPLLSILGRLGLTFLIGFVLLLLSVFPLPTEHLGDVRPAFILMTVYYWAIMFPSTLTYFTVFLIGLSFDLLAGFPPGVNAMTLLIVQWIVRSQRKFMLGQPFRVIWAGLALMAFGAALMQWAVFSLFYGAPLNIRPVLISALLTCLLFPVLLPVLASSGRWLAEKSVRLS